MNRKTHKSRRLSVIVLAATIAAVAVPAATAGPDPGDILGTGIVRSQTLNVQDLLQSEAQEHGAVGFGNPAQAVHVLKAAHVLGPGLNTVEKRGPYGAYWVSKAAQENREFTPSIVDRLVGSPDPRDSADNSLSTSSIVDRTLGSPDPRDAYQEVLGDASFGVPNLDVQDVFAPTAAINAASANWAAKAKLLDINGKPRLDILKSAALEHGAAGFGNSTQLRIGLRKPLSVDYSHLPQGDRPSGITHRRI